MLLHVVATQVEVQRTAVRVHVPGKYYIIHTLQQLTATAAIVIQLAAGFVCCCLLYAIYGSIGSSVLLWLGPKLHTYSSNSCVVLVLAVCTKNAAFAAAAVAAAASCYTGRCFYCVLLAVRKRVRRAAACYAYFRATCCLLLLALVNSNEIQDVSRNVTFLSEV